MINEECNKTQNDAPFATFYDMRAVTFVLPDKMPDVSTAVVYSYTPIKPHGVSQAKWFQILTLFTPRKNIGFGTRITKPAAFLQITRKAAVHLWI